MNLRERLENNEVLLSDGAMGTLLQEHGLEPGQAPEELNLSRPELLSEVAAAYAEAGSDIVHTNSFGASPMKLATHGLANQTAQINTAAAEASLAGVSSVTRNPPTLVSGSIGPCGGILAPYGDADPLEVRAGFLIQAQALLAGGVHCLTIETMSDLAEAVLAVQASFEAAKEFAAEGKKPVPVFATMTFDPTPNGWFTIMGNDIPTVTSELAAAGAVVVGSNCGQGGEGMLEVAKVFNSATDLPLMIQANAGLPVIQDGQVHYPESPAEMAGRVTDLLNAGVRILGGCCGSTIEHIRALRQALDHRPEA